MMQERASGERGIPVRSERPIVQGPRTNRIFTGDLPRHVGERVRVAGWLHHQRGLAHITFVLLRDRSGIAQIVVVDDAARERMARLQPESVIVVHGTVVESDQAPAGVELREPEIEVLVETEDAPPFELRRRELNAQLPTLLDHAAVALRHPRRRAAFALAAASVAGFRATLDAAHFVEIHTPKIVAAATESGANVFPVDWFGRPAFLAQSPQFYKQIMVGVFERVYEVGPVFRAEPHDTARHLAEYVSLDAEVGFIDDHRDVMAVLRDVLHGMVHAVHERAHAALDELELEPSRRPFEYSGGRLHGSADDDRARHWRVRCRRARSRTRARALVGGVGGARVRIGLLVRVWLPDGASDRSIPIPTRSALHSRTALT